MNPLSSLKCASRVLTALAAISGIFLTVGCGSSSSTPPNQNGFSNSSLSGTYVFSSSGVDEPTGSALALAGAFTANGDGTIASGGTMDVVDQIITYTPPNTPAQAITSASYSIGSDGRGQIKLNCAAGNFVLAVVLTSNAHGLVSEFDGNGTGSGTIDLQTATITNLSQISGPYAFIMGGADINNNPFASTGAFVNTSADGVQSGIQDFNDNETTLLGENMFASASLGTGGTAPLSITLTSTFGGLVFDFYPISATQWKLIETDYTEFLAGDAFTQTGATIPNSAMVFTMAGGSVIGAPAAIGGLMVSNGSGGFSSGLADINNMGTISPVQIPFTGTPTGPAGFGGRVQVNLDTDLLPGANTVWVVYPSAAGLLMMEGDGNAVTAGVGYAQTATTFTSGTSVGYGMNLTGANGLPSAVDNIAQFDAGAAGTTPNVTGKLDENDQGTVFGGLTLTGTYTPDSGPTGRGSIVVPTIGTANGSLDLEYYTINSGSALVIEGDTDQVTSGTFQLQATPGADAPNVVRPLFAKVHVKASAKGGSKKSKP